MQSYHEERATYRAKCIEAGAGAARWSSERAPDEDYTPPAALVAKRRAGMFRISYDWSTYTITTLEYGDERPYHVEHTFNILGMPQFKSDGARLRWLHEFAQRQARIHGTRYDEIIIESELPDTVEPAPRVSGRVSSEAKQIAAKLQHWADKNGVDLLAVLSGAVPASAESLVAAVVANVPL